MVSNYFDFATDHKCNTISVIKNQGAIAENDSGLIATNGFEALCNTRFGVGIYSAGGVI
jgi:hypothetical protein